MNNQESQDNLSRYGFYMLLGVFTIQCYIFAYPLFSYIGFNNIHLLRLAAKMHDGFLFFRDLWVAKLVLLGLDLFVVIIGLRPKKKLEIDTQKVLLWLLVGLVLLFASNLLLILPAKKDYYHYILFVLATFLGLFLFHGRVVQLKRIITTNMFKDRFNRKAVQFMQTTEKIETPYSVSIPYEFEYEGKTYKGYINYINLFRALAVLGVPGSGKSYAIIEEVFKQFIQKGFSIYNYDYKYPTLTQIVYNYLLVYNKGYKNRPRFFVINFTDLPCSNRCNPLSVKYMTDIIDAVESAKTLMFALNRSWAKKDGDFFPESAVNFVAIHLWVLRNIELEHEMFKGKDKECSTFAHLIELCSLPYEELFPILKRFGDQAVHNMLAPYISAYEAGASDQLEGQIGTVRIALSRLTSPILYWVMSKDEVPFQINDPENPVLLSVGNNPQRRQVYGAAISLINFRVMQLVNKPHMNPCGLFVDELPTIYPGKGVIDDLIGTGRSNKVATILGFQDTTQMVRDLGKESADAIINTVGNLASGTVLGTTADALSKRMGKIKIKKESVSINNDSTSTSISEELVDVLPPSEIGNLTQGTLFGVVADEFGNVIDEKRFVGKVTLDKSDQTKFPIPKITSFYNEELEKEYEKLEDIEEIKAFEKKHKKEEDKAIQKALQENFQSIRNDIRLLSEETQYLLRQEAEEIENEEE